MPKEDIKFTRKELKEDELVTFSTKALKWLEQNRKPVLITLISILVIIVLYYSITAFTKYRAEKASDEYIEAMEGLEPKSRSQDQLIPETPSREKIKDAISKLETIYNKYGFTGVGKISLLKMAQLYYDIRDYDSSIKYAKEFISRIDTNDPLYPASLLLLANASLAKGDFNGVIDTCDKIINNTSNIMKDEALFISAKALIKLNKKEEAKTKLKELVEKYQTSHLKNEASEIIKKL